jgi:hypothetical protein
MKISRLKVGESNFIKAPKMGEKCVLIRQPGGVLKGYVLHEYKYVPKLGLIFSVLPPPSIMAEICPTMELL